MHRYRVSIATIRAVLLLFIITTILASCATTSSKGNGKELPPILTQDEIIRPYITLGRIQVTADASIISTSSIQEWGFRTLRVEAAKMGADAVMLPEVTSYPSTFLTIPSNEYRARGLAIKFK